MSGPVRTERQGDTWHIQLHCPDKLNALSAALVEGLLDAVQQAVAMQAQLLVFSGVGKSFCAGFDLSALATQSEGDLVLRFVRIEQLLQAVASAPCLTLALGHGRVFGAGVDLFAACKLRVATESTQFRMPGLKFGIVLGSRRFAAIVGQERARAVLEEVATFTAAQALDWGFVQRLDVAPDWTDARAWAQAKLAALDATGRQLLYRALDGAQADTDLAQLVRSAARPGLKDRLLAYQAARG